MTETKPQNPIDALILSAATADYTKTAVIIAKVYDAMPDAGLTPHKDSGKDIAAHLYTLVENGTLHSTGNIRRWRDSAVRLAPAS
jgi:hypothetical protein